MVPIDQASGQCRQARAGRGLHRVLEVAAAINMQLPRGEWNPGRGRAGGQGLPRTRGMAVLGAPPPGQVMPGARGQGAGGQGAGCAQVVGGGASRPPANQRRGVGGQTLQTANQRREENIFFHANIFPENRLRDHINKY